MKTISTQNYSAEQLQKIIFAAAGIDWWKIDRENRTLLLGDGITEILNLPKNLFPLSEVDTLLEEQSVRAFRQNLQNIQPHTYLSIPLKKTISENRRVFAVITSLSSLEILGYIKIENRKDSVTLPDDAKLSFVANMSHELRTPLNVIVGFSKILAETEDPVERKEFLKIILDNNELLLQLINDILDLSKIEAGMLDTKFSNVDLIPAIQEVAQGIQLRIPSSQIKFILEAPQLASFFIRTDRNRLIQVINNLVNNAIKFTSKGKIKLNYRISEKEIRFAVLDTGTGIPHDKLQQIFNRFVRLDQRIAGTGLGLEISSSIIHHLGGEIGVESELGKGSTFWFTLPNNQPDPQDNAFLQNQNRESGAPENLKPLVLIAEDDASNYRLYEVLLNKHYRLLHAWNGEEAIKLFSDEKPDLIIMDINMPIMNGYEATVAIRKKSWEIPIVATTAYAMADDEEAILKSGFDVYISKPIDIRKLETVLEKCLHK